MRWETGGRLTRLLAAAFLGAVALAPAARARDLTVVSWGGPYQNNQRAVFFKPFMEATKIPLQEATWDGGIGILRAKVEGGNLDWDVIQVESDELALGCEEGLYVKLDWSKIGGKDIYIPATVSTCGVGASIYSYVLAYDGDRLKDGPKSWADFFDLKKFPGKRSMRSGPKPTLEIALMADGVDPKDVYKVLGTPAGVDRAFKKLDTIKSSMVWWTAGNQPIQLLASGDVVMATAYNPRIHAANLEPGKHFKAVWSQSLFGIDSWVILKGTPNLDAAYKFLDFIGDAHRQAKMSDIAPMGMSNKATNGLVDKAVLSEMPTAPENFAHSVAINVPFWIENFDKLNDRYTKWAAQ
jgi:putative spermidine/putrescine transport system substrate-binding protein